MVPAVLCRISARVPSRVALTVWYQGHAFFQMISLQLHLPPRSRLVRIVLALLVHVLLSQRGCACKPYFVVALELTVVIHKVRIDIDCGCHCNWLALSCLVLQLAPQSILVLNYGRLFSSISKIRDCRGLCNRFSWLLHGLWD